MLGTSNLDLKLAEIDAKLDEILRRLGENGSPCDNGGYPALPFPDETAK